MSENIHSYIAVLVAAGEAGRIDLAVNIAAAIVCLYRDNI